MVLSKNQYPRPIKTGFRAQALCLAFWAQSIYPLAFTMALQHNKYTTKLLEKNVLVIGGTSGIGFCVAEACLAFGATVTISSSNQKKLAHSVERLQASNSTVSPSKIRSFACDLSIPDRVETNVKELLEFAARPGPINHIVYTAGDSLSLRPLNETTIPFIQEVGLVRSVVPIILAKLARSHLVSSLESSLTLTGGTVSLKPPPGWTPYSTWAAGQEGATRSLAIELKPIRVNLVVPGVVDTELFQQIPEEMRSGLMDELKEKTLNKELGRPEDVAEAYLYAMRDRFLTGSMIYTNGGTLLV